MKYVDEFRDGDLAGNIARKISLEADRQRRYQSPDMVRDGSELNNIRDNLHGGQSAAWLQQYVDYHSWYRYSAVAEAIRHYDYAKLHMSEFFLAQCAYYALPAE